MGRSCDKKKDCCEKPTLIDYLPYSIVKSGCYKLCRDLKFVPVERDSSAITIDASDVDLDLNCHRLYQAKSTYPVNPEISIVDLPNANLSTIAIGSPVVNVFEPGHGRENGDDVFLISVDGNVGGIDDSDIEGQRFVTVVDADNWTLVADAVATSVASGGAGTFTIFFNSGTRSPGFGAIGISLSSEEDRHNITIKNGTIELFTGSAIVATGNPNSWDVLSFENLHLLSNGGEGDSRVGALEGSGILLSDTPFEPDLRVYTSVKIENCELSNNTGVALKLQGGENIIVENTSINNTFLEFQSNYPNSVFNARGARVEFTRNLQIINSTINGTNSLISTSNVSGIQLTRGSTDVTVLSSQINGTSGAGFNVYAFLCSSIKNLTVENTQINNTSYLPENVIVNGACAAFHASGEKNERLSFKNCQFNNTSSSGKAVFFGESKVAFVHACELFGAANVLFDGCEVIGLKANITGATTQNPIAGISIIPWDRRIDGDPENSPNIVFRNCFVSEIHSNTEVAGIRLISGTISYFATEFGAQVRDVVIQDCVISNVTTSSCCATCDGISLDNDFGYAVDAYPSVFYGKIFNVKIENCNISNIRRTDSFLQTAMLTFTVDGGTIPPPLAGATEIPVASGVGFPDSGTLLVETTEGLESVTYTGITYRGLFRNFLLPFFVPTPIPTFTGCSATIGDKIDGGLVTTLDGQGGSFPSFFSTAAIRVASNGEYPDKDGVVQKGFFNTVENIQISKNCIQDCVNGILFSLNSSVTNSSVTENNVNNCSNIGYGDVTTDVNAWTANKAYNNAINYEILAYDIPVLDSVLSAGTAEPSNPDFYFAGLHNISIRK